MKQASNFLKSVREFSIGLVIFIAILWFFTGSLSSALGMIFVATICTAGIGGLVIVLISLALGKLTNYIFRKLTSKNSPVQNARIVESKNRNQIALDNYIREARLAHMSNQEITSQLMAAQWSEDEIKTALQI